MILLTLFALSPVFPVVATSAPFSTPTPAPTPATTNVLTPFAATAAATTVAATTMATVSAVSRPATSSPSDNGSRSQGPGVVVVYTNKSKDRAYALMNRLNELGLIIMGYEEEDFATYRLRVFEAQVALDSCGKRNDVRSKEVGIITFDKASEILPDIARDSTLEFAIAISSDISLERMERRFHRTRAATLLIQGVTSSKSIKGSSGSRNSMSNAASAASAASQATSSKSDPSKPTLPQRAALKNSTLQNAVFHSISRSYNSAKLVGDPVATDFLRPNVSFWTVSRTDVSIVGEAKSKLGAMVMTWIQEQVHTTPISQAREVRITN